MTLKCISENLNSFDGRGYDNLPELFLSQIQNSLIGQPSRHDLAKSLQVLTKILTDETKSNSELDYRFEKELKLIAEMNLAHDM